VVVPADSGNDAGGTLPQLPHKLSEAQPGALADRLAASRAGKEAGPVYGLSCFRRRRSSLAMLGAMRRASSRVSRLAAVRRPGSASRNRRSPACPFLSLDDEARVVVLLDRPRRRGAAGWGPCSDQKGALASSRERWQTPIRSELLRLGL
jgi:hypothetical protein